MTVSVLKFDYLLITAFSAEKHGQVKQVGQTSYSITVSQGPHSSPLSQNLSQNIGSFHATADTVDHYPQLGNQRASL